LRCLWLTTLAGVVAAAAAAAVLLLVLLLLRLFMLSEELHTPCSLRSCDIWVWKRNIVTFC
jgi:hypothetical protein